MMVTADKSLGWWKNGGSQLEVGTVTTWADAYALRFQPLGWDGKEPVEPVDPDDSPIQFSENTGAGAKWFYIQYYDKVYNNRFVCLTPNGLNETLGMSWDDPNFSSPEDKFLYCFVGDMVNGFTIYNRAYLAGKTVDGQTLTEDIPVRECNRDGVDPSEWRDVGIYADTLSVEGSVWLFLPNSHDLEDEKCHMVSFAEQQRAWNLTGASTVETGPNTVTWGENGADTRMIRFRPVGWDGTEPSAPTTGVQATPADDALCCVVSGNEVRVLNASEGVNVYSINGAVVLENAMSPFCLESGLYILKVDEKVCKVIVR